jgi:hypothetical protein
MNAGFIALKAVLTAQFACPPVGRAPNLVHQV